MNGKPYDPESTGVDDPYSPYREIYYNEFGDPVSVEMG
jgi:hypothetical protein